MQKTGIKYRTKECMRCGRLHEGYSGKLDAHGIEYVVCGNTHKRMNVHPEGGFRDRAMYATEWEVELPEKIVTINDLGAALCFFGYWNAEIDLWGDDRSQPLFERVNAACAQKRKVVLYERTPVRLRLPHEREARFGIKVRWVATDIEEIRRRFADNWNMKIEFIDHHGRRCL